MRTIDANTQILLLFQHLFRGLYDTEPWKLYFKGSQAIWKDIATHDIWILICLFITQLIYLIPQWKNCFVEENTTLISCSSLPQIRKTLKENFFSSLSATRIPLNRHLCLSFPICKSWRLICFSDFPSDSRKYVADSVQFRFTFLGSFDLKAQKYAKPHDI